MSDLSRSFVVIDADWTAAQAREMLALGVKYAIVHRRETDQVYVFSCTELASALELRDVSIGFGGRPVREMEDAARVVRDAVRLETRSPAPVAHADGAHPDGLAVVLDRGRIAALHIPGQRFEYLKRKDRAVSPPANGSPPPPGADERDLTATMPAEVAVGQTATLLVAIGALGVHGAAAPAIPARRGASIELEVEAGGCLEIVEPAQATVKIDTDEEIVHRFRVKGRTPGIGRVMVRAFEESRQIGLVAATVSVVAGAGASGAVVSRGAHIEEVEVPPDLEMEIVEGRERNQYEVILNGRQSALGLNRKRFGPFVLGGDIDEYFTRFYEDIEGLLRSSSSAPDKQAQLAQMGLYLFERVFPLPDLRDRLWAIRDRIRTVRIQSEEPWVPWELCRLWGKDESGQVTENQFLAERYSVTRWFLEVPEVRSISISKIGLIVPSDGGLGAAGAEMQNVEKLKSASCTVSGIECHPIELRQALATGEYDVLHFVGHGSYGGADADRSSFKLEDGTRFTPRDLAGPPANCGRPHPLVVLNACEVGRSGTTLGGLSGWPQAFVRVGAAAFIGPRWKTADASAAEFSGLIYEALLKGETLGEAVRNARLAIRAADDPTWLAYTVYGHPDARVSSAPGGGTSDPDVH